MAVCAEVAGYDERTVKKTKKKRKRLAENAEVAPENGSKCVKKKKNKSKKDKTTTSGETPSLDGSRNGVELETKDRSNKISEKTKKKIVCRSADDAFSKSEGPDGKEKRQTPDKADITPITAQCRDSVYSDKQQKQPVRKKKKKRLMEKGSDVVALASIESTEKDSSSNYKGSAEKTGSLCGERLKDDQRALEKKAAVDDQRKKTKKKSKRLVENVDRHDNGKNQNNDSNQKDSVTEHRGQMLSTKLNEVSEKNSSNLANGSAFEGTVIGPLAKEKTSNKKAKKKKKKLEVKSGVNSNAMHKVKGTEPVHATSTIIESQQTITTNVKKKKSKRSSELPAVVTMKQQEKDVLRAMDNSKVDNTLHSENERKVVESSGNQTAKKKKKRKKGNGTSDSPSKVSSNDVLSADANHEVLQKKKKRKRDSSDEPKTSKKRKEEGAAESPKDNLGQWSTAKLANSAQQDKFVRLLGGAKSVAKTDPVSSSTNGQSILSKLSGVWKPPPGRKLFGALVNKQKQTFASMAMDENQSQKLAAKLENQFNKTLEFNLQKRKESNSAKGLGFQEDPARGKTHYIDIHKVNSIALD